MGTTATKTNPRARQGNFLRFMAQLTSDSRHIDRFEGSTVGTPRLPQMKWFTGGITLDKAGSDCQSQKQWLLLMHPNAA
jgi:hypothetical protein